MIAKNITRRRFKQEIHELKWHQQVQDSILVEDVDLKKETLQHGSITRYSKIQIQIQYIKNK